ncbi:hypothetical protein Dimus_007451 [Dionaea muscipula]
MTRKRIKLAWILNAGSRRITFKKRRLGLAKKMEELTTLCGIQGCLLIFNPDGEDMFVWPSCEKAKELLTKFESMPKLEQGKKMMNHAKYMQERNEKLHQDIAKYEKRNKEMKASLVMYDMCQGQGKTLHETNEEDLELLRWFADQKFKEIRRRTQLLPPTP